MISRRDWLARSLGAGAALALTPELLRALRQMPAPLIQRTIPSSGERIPVIGLGRGSRPADPAALKEVIRTLVDGGGRLVDTVHGGPAAEQATGTAANELGVQSKVFWSVPLPPNLDAAAARAKIETSLATLKVPRIDLVQVLAVTDVPPAIFAMLREMKQEGRIRYIGVTDLLPPQTTNHPVAPRLEPIMRNEPIDFVGFDYSVGDRRAEQVLLPLAQERKIAVLAYFVFDRSRGLARVGNTPLPEWAAEFDATTWAQFFIKYVISHPAVTVARTGTSNPAHMLENLGGGTGRLPDEAMRKRMAAFIDALPPVAAPAAPAPSAAQAPGIALSAAVLDRYVGEWKLASGTVVAFRRQGTTLFVKPGTGQEIPLNARSETRLQDPRGPVFEFQVDAGGKVTGLILEQRGERMALTRK